MRILKALLLAVAVFVVAGVSFWLGTRVARKTPPQAVSAPRRTNPTPTQTQPARIKPAPLRYYADPPLSNRPSSARLALIGSVAGEPWPCEIGADGSVSLYCETEGAGGLSASYALSATGARPGSDPTVLLEVRAGAEGGRSVLRTSVNLVQEGADPRYTLSSPLPSASPVLVTLRPGPNAGGLQCERVAVGGTPATAAQSGAQPPSARPAQRPNIIICILDALRRDHVTAYGYARDTTANVGRFAQEGVAYDNAYVAGAWTRASVASLLTGGYPSLHHAKWMTDALPPENVLFSEVAQANGYYTCALALNGNLAPVFGFDQGWDDYEFLIDEALKTHATRLKRMLSSATSTHKPVFLFVHAVEPHGPYEPPGPYVLRYDPDYRGLADGTLEQMAGILDGRYVATPRDFEHLMAMYDAYVRVGDEGFGRLVALLKSLGMYDNSIIIFTSDHGEAFWEHQSLQHGKVVYQEEVRVPLIVRWPRATDAGKREGQVVSLIDVFPSLCAYLGVKPKLPYPVAGRSFILPSSLSRGGTARRLLYFEQGPGVFPQHERAGALLDGRWKLVYNPARKTPRNLPAPPLELYDLQGDPAERRDLADAHPVMAGYLASALTSFWHEQERYSRAVLTRQARKQKGLPEEVKQNLRALGYLK